MLRKIRKARQGHNPGAKEVPVAGDLLPPLFAPAIEGDFGARLHLHGNCSARTVLGSGHREIRLKIGLVPGNHPPAFLEIPVVPEDVGISKNRILAIDRDHEFVWLGRESTSAFAGDPHTTFCRGIGHQTGLYLS